MEGPLRAAARALAAFDPLEALRHVALRDDPPALAMRGIAMAQLGDLPRARKLLRRAARAFGAADPLARARCLAAEGEAALAARDLVAAERGLEEAAAALEHHGDRENALFARLQLVERLVLVGSLGEAARALASLDREPAAPRMAAISALLEADIAVRTVRPRAARGSLERAREAARDAAIPTLVAEVERAARSLDAPVARHRHEGQERAITLEAVEALLGSEELVIDACRAQVRGGRVTVSFAGRPVLFALAVALGEAAPADATRETLVGRAFGARSATDSLRARLRVEIGRLRRALSALADVGATRAGFSLQPRRGDRVHVLLPPGSGESSAVIAVLDGGESWSTSALAAAVGSSQRTVQRELAALQAQGRVQAVGRGRSRRWMADRPTGFATTLLLSRTVAPRLGDGS
jgi:tetratricopeptide (TPR) repeat protein